MQAKNLINNPGVYVYVCVCVHVCVHMCKHVYMYVAVYMCVSVYICMYACIPVFVLLDCANVSVCDHPTDGHHDIYSSSNTG